jgi:hypothetical protein
LYVVPGVSMLRPAEAVFEKTLHGFADHQRASGYSLTLIEALRSGDHPWVR